MDDEAVNVMLKTALSIIMGKTCLVDEVWTGTKASKEDRRDQSIDVMHKKVGLNLSWATIIRVHKTEQEEFIDVEYIAGTKRELEVPSRFIERDRIRNLKCVLGNFLFPSARDTAGLTSCIDDLIKEKNFENEQWKLLRGGFLDKVDKDNGQTLLWAAARANRLDICRFLREDLKASVNKGDENGQTPFITACTHEACFDSGIANYLQQPLTITIRAPWLEEKKAALVEGRYNRERDQVQRYKREKRSSCSEPALAAEAEGGDVFFEFNEISFLNYGCPSHGFKVYTIQKDILTATDNQKVLLKNVMTYPGLFTLQDGDSKAITIKPDDAVKPGDALQQKGSDMKRHFNRLCPGLLTVLGGGSSTVARDPVADIDIKGLAADVDQPDNRGGSALFFVVQRHFQRLKVFTPDSTDEDKDFETLRVANDLLSRGADVRSIGWKDAHIACQYFKSWKLNLITTKYKQIGKMFISRYPLLKDQFAVTGVCTPTEVIHFGKVDEFLSNTWMGAVKAEGVKQDYAQPPISFYRLPHPRMATVETLEALVLSTMIADDTDVFDERNVVVAAVVKYMWKQRWSLHVTNTIYHILHLAVLTNCMTRYLPANDCDAAATWMQNQLLWRLWYWFCFWSCGILWLVSCSVFVLKMKFFLFGNGAAPESAPAHPQSRSARKRQLRQFVLLSAFYFVLDFASIVSIFSALCARLSCSFSHGDCDQTNARFWFAIAAVAMWSKLLYFLRPYNHAGHIMKMVMVISRSLFWFFIVFGIEFLAFSQGLLEISPNPNASFYGSWLDAFIQTYGTMMGDSKFDIKATQGTTSSSLFTALICSHTFIATVGLSNLLVGYISYVYERVEKEEKRASVLLERAAVLLDHEWTVQVAATAWRPMCVLVHSLAALATGTPFAPFVALITWPVDILGRLLSWQYKAPDQLFCLRRTFDCEEGVGSADGGEESTSAAPVQKPDFEKETLIFETKLVQASRYAELNGLLEQTVVQLADDGDIPFINLDGRYIFNVGASRVDLERAIVCPSKQGGKARAMYDYGLRALGSQFVRSFDYGHEKGCISRSTWRTIVSKGLAVEEEKRKQGAQGGPEGQGGAGGRGDRWAMWARGTSDTNPSHEASTLPPRPPPASPSRAPSAHPFPAPVAAPEAAFPPPATVAHAAISSSSSIGSEVDHSTRSAKTNLTLDDLGSWGAGPLGLSFSLDPGMGLGLGLGLEKPSSSRNSQSEPLVLTRGRSDDPRAGLRHTLGVAHERTRSAPSPPRSPRSALSAPSIDLVERWNIPPKHLLSFLATLERRGVRLTRRGGKSVVPRSGASSTTRGGQIGATAGVKGGGGGALGAFSVDLCSPEDVGMDLQAQIALTYSISVANIDRIERELEGVLADFRDVERVMNHIDISDFTLAHASKHLRKRGFSHPMMCLRGKDRLFRDCYDELINLADEWVRDLDYLRKQPS